MSLLTKNQILASEDLPTEIVPVPEWGGEVKIRVIAANAKDEWEQAVMAMKESKRWGGFRALLISYSIIDEDGKPMFSKSEVEELGKKSAVAIDRVYDAVRKLNLFDKAELEKLEKN